MKITKVIQDKTVVCNFDPKGRGIYRWTFISNSQVKIYLGKTKVSFGKRTTKHLWEVSKEIHSKDFQTAWDECDRVIIDSVETIESDDNSIYLSKEQEWINTYGIDNLVNCYNYCIV